MNFIKCLKRIIFGESLQRTLIRSSILILGCFVIFKFLLLPVRIEGKSMEPTYRNGSFTFINALRYSFIKPRRFDVVAIRMAGNRVMLLKRIIGLPGELISFRDGKLIINGKTIPEEYIKSPYDWNMPEVKVELDEYFVAGDNRIMPIEQHELGRVSSSKIIGGPLF